jgi:hypothetical protein
MNLDIRYLPEIVSDRRDISPEEWSEIEAVIGEVREEGNSHDDVKLVPNPRLEHAVWQLTVEKKETNHRIFLDIESGALIVLAAWNFEFTHSGDQHWEKLQERL